MKTDLQHHMAVHGPSRPDPYRLLLEVAEALDQAATVEDIDPLTQLDHHYQPVGGLKPALEAIAQDWRAKALEVTRLREFTLSVLAALRGDSAMARVMDAGVQLGVLVPTGETNDAGQRMVDVRWSDEGKR